MGKMILLAPAAVQSIAASRGVGANNLLRADPKETWADTAKGSDMSFYVDFGRVRPIDTIFLGHVHELAPEATWGIYGGQNSRTDAVLMRTALMRVPDTASRFASVSHALWHGSPVDLRYLQIDVFQPASAPPMAIGTFMAGHSFSTRYAREWGAGRGVIDTGSATPLPGGGFAMVEGARKGGFSWSFGDLDDAETDALYEMQLDLGETRPLLVVEDAARTTGLVNRLHYGRFKSLKPYKRRNPAQTRWELEMEEWV